MRIIFSRKGFDLGAGGAPSPIVNGRPISLLIPTKRRSHTSYEHLGLGDLVERVTRGRIPRDHLCHEDPMFIQDQCVFGQCGAAQSHLENQKVGSGDAFVFFGLFSDEFTGERHHRIFGYLQVGAVIAQPSEAAPPVELNVLPRTHPHLLGEWNLNNTLYCGAGGQSRRAGDALRLTQPGGPLLHWVVPNWLRETGLSFHGRPERWFADERLSIVARGQEFVADVGDRPDARRWLDGVIEAIHA